MPFLQPQVIVWPALLRLGQFPNPTLWPSTIGLAQLTHRYQSPPPSILRNCGISGTCRPPVLGRQLLGVTCRRRHRRSVLHLTGCRPRQPGPVRPSTAHWQSSSEPAPFESFVFHDNATSLARVRDHKDPGRLFPAFRQSARGQDDQDIFAIAAFLEGNGRASVASRFE